MRRAPATLHGVVFDVLVVGRAAQLAFTDGFGATAFARFSRSLTFGGVGRSI